MNRSALFILAAILGLTAGYLWSRPAQPNAYVDSEANADAHSRTSEDDELARLGYINGDKLIAYAFGGTGCGYCQLPTTKAVYSALRDSLQVKHVDTGPYKSLTVIGIALDAELEQGWQYLSSFTTGSGKHAFDQMSIGSGWQNEHVVRLLRRMGFGDPALPLVVLVRRRVEAKLEPLRVGYGVDDELVGTIQGSERLRAWMDSGMPLTTSRSLQPESSGKTKTSPLQP